jgi:acetyl esterase/lipase
MRQTIQQEQIQGFILRSTVQCLRKRLDRAAMMELIPKMKPSSQWILALCCALVLFQSRASEPPKTIELWPGTPPGQPREIAPERDTTGPKDNLVAGRSVERIGNVSKPTITIYKPAADKATGVSVMVCPGGGYHILATDLEGTEVCAWLNSIGVSGILLKYRVPGRPGETGHPGPLQDAQRAIGLIRQHAREWGLDSKRIGVLGFSAGGHLAAALSNNYDERNYQQVDEADALSCRPDFTVLVYPAYLTVAKENDQLAPEMKVTENTPPTFISITADDPVRVENAMYYALALRKAKVPLELHVYAAGGHGYGLRLRQDLPVTSWPERLADWMRSRALLAKAE